MTWTILRSVASNMAGTFCTEFEDSLVDLTSTELLCYHSDSDLSTFRDREPNLNINYEMEHVRNDVISNND